MTDYDDFDEDFPVFCDNNHDEERNHDNDDNNGDERFPVDQHQIILDKLKTLGGSGPHKDASDDLESVCLRFGTMTKISRMLGLHKSILLDDFKFRQGSSTFCAQNLRTLYAPNWLAEVQEHLHATLSCVKRLKRKPGYPRDR